MEGREPLDQGDQQRYRDRVDERAGSDLARWAHTGWLGPADW